MAIYVQVMQHKHA